MPRGVVAGATTTVVAPNPHPANVAPPHVDENMNSMDNVPNPKDDLEVGEIGSTMVVGVPVDLGGNQTNEMEELQSQLPEKDGFIAMLQDTIQNLQL